MFTAPDDSRLVGYARVSTGSHDLDLQIDALQKYGVAKELIFTDKASGASEIALGLTPVSMSFVMETCCSSGDLTDSDVPYATWSR